MAGVSVKEATALNRIAAKLGKHVTNAFIDQVGSEHGYPRLDGSNKTKKIQSLLTGLLGDGRTRARAADVIEALVVEAHHRTVDGKAEMTEAEAEGVVEDMKLLGLGVGQLGRAHWRTGLKGGPSPRSGAVSMPAAPSSTPNPRRHEEALLYIQQLASEDRRPQHRGRELEKIVADVLTKEGLRAAHNIVNPGEQIDVAFVLQGHHYLVECRWEKAPQGLPALREFSDKVRRKAEGTFGVLVSMSGFVNNINATASQGSRLNCVGMTSREFMPVLEGRTTFAAVVESARAGASRRTLFYVEYT